MMLPKFFAVVEGVHFVVGANFLALKEAVSKHEVLHDLASSFMGLGKALVSLPLDDLWALGGFAIAVQPKQVLEVPGGYLLAETPLSAKALVISWTSFRPVELPWADEIKEAAAGVEADLKLESPLAKEMPDPKTSNKEFLLKMKAQLEIAPKVVEWAKEILPSLPQTDFGQQIELANLMNMAEQIHELYAKYNGEARFRKKALEVIEMFLVFSFHTSYFIRT